MAQRSTPPQQLLDEVNSNQLSSPSVRVLDYESRPVAASPSPDYATHAAPKGITTSSTPEDNITQSQIAAPESSRSVAATNGPTSAIVQKAKKSFNPKWYACNATYSDSTLYNKVGIPQMKAFLAGEGVDVDTEFANGTYPRYIERDHKRVKINKGQALMEMVNKVHERVLNRQKAGFEVAPNQAPHLGAEDWEAQISASDGPAAAVVDPGNALEARRKQKISVRAKGNEQAVAAEVPGYELQVKGSERMAGGVLSAMASNVPMLRGPQSLTGSMGLYKVWSEPAFVQRLDQLRQDLTLIKTAVMSELLGMNIKAVENAETPPTAYKSDSSNVAQQAQANTSELNRLIRDSHDRVVITAQVQGLVRQIIDAAIRFRDIERHFVPRDGSRAMLHNEGHDVNHEYQRARSDLMQKLAANVLWDRHIQRGGYRVAEIVLQVIPAKALELLN